MLNIKELVMQSNIKPNLKSNDNTNKSIKDFDTLMDKIKNELMDSIQPYVLNNINSYQIKQIKKKFSLDQEYKVRTYKREKDYALKVFPVGNLKRLAEQKAQEVIMNGNIINLPHMGGYERFVIHDYLKNRNGIKTQSYGKEGKDRHIKICPLFGRKPKKAKKKLTI